MTARAESEGQTIPDGEREGLHVDGAVEEAQVAAEVLVRVRGLPAAQCKATRCATKKKDKCVVVAPVVGRREHVEGVQLAGRT
jgi:hypothetical protein